MTLFDRLLLRINHLAQQECASVSIYRNGISYIRFYFIGGGFELARGIDTALMPKIYQGGIEELFAAQWESANQALIVESGFHLFLSKIAWETWLDAYGDDDYRRLDLVTLDENDAERELALLAES